MVGDILQPTHLLFILVVALLVLGPKRLPEVGRTLGSGLRDFRAAINGESTSRDDHEPRGYVEPEPDPVAPLEPELEPDDVHVFGDEPDMEQTEPDHTATIDSPVAADPMSQPASSAEIDSHQPSASDDLLPPSADEDLQPPSTSVSAEPESVPAPAAPAPASGFASALAASRQRATGSDEPADDE